MNCVIIDNMDINIKKTMTVVLIFVAVAVVVSLGIVGSLSKVVSFLGTRLLFLFK